ncbi:MAG: 30S ribosomal protein S20 [Clostridiales bacterium]|nr:30S ribosomal protein S20 [Clostridiales bacterium]
MANIKSAIKRAELNRTQNLRNRMAKSEMKTIIRRFDEALKANADDKETVYTLAVKTVDQAASKGVIHKNAANRKKAQLAKKLAAN